MVAELLYLEKQGSSLPIEMLINSSGTTRQDGEILAFDSEGIALTSTMGFIKNPISTVNMGLAVGWSCVVLSFGRKGWRKSLPHSLAMLQQPRVPPTGAQAGGAAARSSSPPRGPRPPPPACPLLPPPLPPPLPSCRFLSPSGADTI